MRKFKIIILISFLCLLSFLYWLHIEANPKRQGLLEIPGLAAAVSVQYDEFGIPHIEAKSEEDAYLSLGYLMAQDRLFQMDILRRLAKGQLAEIIGPKALPVDKFHRELQFYKKMAENFKAHKHLLSPQLLKIVNQYLKGLNYYIDSRILPLEFHLLRYKPEKFSIEDMYAFMAYMSYTFTEGITSDSFFEDNFHSLPQEKWQELLASFPTEDSPSILDSPLEISKTRDTKPSIARLNFNFKNLNQVHSYIGSFLPTFMGSNSAVLSASRNSTNKPVLLNDPHIGFSNPSVWYEAHIVTPDLNLYGHYLAYVPFAVLGQTEHHSWAITMSEVDDLDLYLESITQDKNHSIVGDERVPIVKHKEQIKIRGEQDLTIETLSSTNGPILKDTLKTDEKHLVSMKWAVYEKNNLTLQSFYEMARAKDLTSFEAAIHKSYGPGLNISYIDNVGNIAWFIMGGIPKRPPGRDGNRILNGQDPNDQYLGYYSHQEKPQIVNPANGIIITANNQSSSKAEHSFNGYFQDPDRGRRLYDIFKQKDIWSIEELKEIHNDNTSPFYDLEVGFLLAELKPDILQKYPELINEIKNWNGYFGKKLIAPTIFETWKRQVAIGILEDELGINKFISFFKIGKFTHFMHYIFRTPKSTWWDNIKTADKVEGPSDIISSAFLKTVNQLELQLGSDWKTWKWGKLHTLEFVHPLGRAKYLDKIFNLGPFPVNGNRGIVNAMASKKWDQAYKVTSGPSTRRVVVMDEPNFSWGIIPTGNSGHILDPHNKDQMELYINGKYRKQYMNLNLAETNSPYGRLEIVNKED